jgi:hypothetical protein
MTCPPTLLGHAPMHEDNKIAATRDRVFRVVLTLVPPADAREAQVVTEC